MLFMYLPEWVQKFKEPRTEIKKVKGYFYKYAVEYRYNPTKKRTDKRTIELLGKITREDGFIPSEKKLLKDKLQKTEPEKVDIKIYGDYALFNELLKDEIASLRAVFGDADTEVLSVVALMRFSYQDPIKKMARHHRHSYCSNFWHQNNLSDKEISSTLARLGEKRQLLVEWMAKKLSDQDPKKSTNPYVMIDSTSFTSKSEQLNINAKGYNPSKTFDEQLRLMYLFSSEEKQPVYYRLIAGNINDVSSMKLCVEELGTPHVVFIADKGFYSKKNVSNLRENNLKYIIPLYRNNALIDREPLLQADFKVKNAFFIHEKRIIWHYEYQKEGQRLVTYLDENLRTEEERDYLLRTETHPDEYSKEKFNKKLADFGSFTLTTNTGLDAEELYKVYKQRNEIEVLFDAYKNVLKADVTYMQNRMVLEGWLMANFLAMIVYYKLYNRLKEAKMLNHYSPMDILDACKSIYMLKIKDHWRLAEVTKKNTDLFKKLNIDYLNERS